MTEQERYTIEKDIINEKLCIWDYDDLICEIDDDKTLTTLVNLLNKLNEENEELKQERINGAKIFNEIVYKNEINALKKENEKLKHELLCKQLDKAPTEPINCKCYYKELKE